MRCLSGKRARTRAETIASRSAADSPSRLHAPHRGKVSPGRIGRAGPFDERRNEKQRSRRHGAKTVEASLIGRALIVRSSRIREQSGQFVEDVGPDRNDAHRTDLTHSL
jgi:hypothetical protein